ncbi:unnamed protein product [Notodromas monacha]|uniref:Peptidase S1 domain-containing protein n=1 Tax=Notodromas monacha TaxID=399045 RepID=A0A7R9BSR7_9CRUS|nr:unnamed protein product [Notodromas monacha]CAG0921050.1 unnamed protein product [Notodromas monacha]
MWNVRIILIRVLFIASQFVTFGDCASPVNLAQTVECGNSPIGSLLFRRNGGYPGNVAASGLYIVGGNDAARGQYPFMVSLSSKASPTSHFCGASMIHEQWAMTAAHCVGSDTNSIYVVIRDYNKDTASEAGQNPDQESILAIKRIIHPDYSSSTFKLSGPDVALLKLERSVVWDNYVQPVCLPPTDFDSDGMEATGDSGGPLFVSLEGKYTEIGIVSWGIKCAKPFKPGVYSRVSKFVDWLVEAVAEQNPKNEKVLWTDGKQGGRKDLSHQPWNVDCNENPSEFRGIITAIWDDANNFGDIDKVKCRRGSASFETALLDQSMLQFFSATPVDLCPKDYVLTALWDEFYDFDSVMFGKCQKLKHSKINYDDCRVILTDEKSGGASDLYKRWNVECDGGMVGVGLKRNFERILEFRCCRIEP